MDLPDIEPFNAKFEDVEISIHKLKVIEFIDDNEGEAKYSAKDAIWDKGISRHYYVIGMELVGDMSLSFRNQGAHFDSIIFADCTFSASSKTDSIGSSIMAKFLQYLYEWFKEYIQHNDIKDMLGNESFKMPIPSPPKGFFEAYDLPPQP